MDKMAALTMRLDDLVEKRVRCPLCSEKILAAARKCKHCGEFISRPDEEPASDLGDIAADDAGGGDAREGSSRISLPVLAALMLIGGGGAIVLGMVAMGAQRPAVAAQTQAVAPATPSRATPPAEYASQPIAENCDAPEVLASIARGLQKVQRLPERPVPRDRFVDLETIARTDQNIECGVTLAAGPHSDDIRAGYYHVEYRSPVDPSDSSDFGNASDAAAPVN
jgi:hypothetical protein